MSRRYHRPASPGCLLLLACLVGGVPLIVLFGVWAAVVATVLLVAAALDVLSRRSR